MIVKVVVDPGLNLLDERRTEKRVQTASPAADGQRTETGWWALGLGGVARAPCQ